MSEVLSRKRMNTITIIGTIVTVLSLGYAIYVTQINKKNIEFKYAIEPERTILLDSEKTASFEIYYNGRKLSNDVTSVTLTVWNSGNIPIKKENILQQIEIHLEKSINILDTKILRMSRDITNISLKTKDSERGIIMLDWDILEPDDGAVIQIIYEGTRDVPINIDGIIEGKKEIKEFILSKPKIPIYQYILILLPTVFILITEIYLFFKYKTKVRKTRILLIALYILMPIILFLIHKYIPINVPVTI